MAAAAFTTADTDAANGLRDIKHTASSTDTNYNNVSIRLTATESDITTRALSVTSVSPSGATLNLGPTGEAWYYKRIQPTGVNTCHSVAKGTTTAALSTLTAGALYGYTAYSDSACTSANAEDTIYFSASDDGVSNLGENAPSGACSIGKAGSLDATCAIEFTTDDANTAGYALRSVTTRFNAKNGSPANIVAAIHKADTGNGLNPASTATITLNGSNPDTAGLHTFNCVASATNDCTLDDDEDYFLVMSAPGSGFNAGYQWPSWTSVNEDIWPANSDWEIANEGRSKSGNLAWSGFGANITLPIHVAADKKGTLSSSNVTSSGATLTLTGFSHTTWYYKHSGATATCSTAQTGTSVTLTGLTPATTYNYTAYEDSSCLQDVSSTATFTTAGLVFTPTTPTVSENGTGTYTVKLSHRADGECNGGNRRRDHGQQQHGHRHNRKGHGRRHDAATRPRTSHSAARHGTRRAR